MLATYPGELSPSFNDIARFLDISWIGTEKLCEDANFSFFHRKTLSEFNTPPRIIKQFVSSNRQKFDYIVVDAKSADLASFAARDGRVDAVRISPRSSIKLFNKRYSRRLLENNTMVEIDFGFMWEGNLAKSLRPMLRVLETFKNTDLKYVLVNETTDETRLRSYRGLQAIGRLFGLTNKSTSPRWLVERIEENRRKIDGRNPFSGVETNGSEN